MPQVDLNDGPQDSPREFVLVPEGEYSCRIVKVESSYTKNDIERWNLTFEIIEGEFAGSKIWDALYFSAARPGKKWGAIDRVRKLCRAIGLDGNVILLPSMLKDRRVVVTVDGSESYTGRDGNERVKPKVGFMGFKAMPDQAADADVPF